MLIRRFSLRPGTGPAIVELRLDGTTVTQRTQATGTDPFSDNETVFTSAFEAREAFDRLVGIYSRKGQLLSAEGDANAPLRVLQVSSAVAGAHVVVDDWLLEEGPALLGELYELFTLGALPLEFDGKRLTGATLASFSTPSRARYAEGGRAVHQLHFVLEQLLRLPLSHSLRRLTLVERPLDTNPDDLRFVPMAMALAVRAAARAPVATSLTHLEAGSFERPGEGKPDLKPALGRLPALTELQLVFSQGLLWSALKSPLRRLAVGWLSSTGQLAPLFSSVLPGLEQLSVGLKRGANLDPRALDPVLRGEVFPGLQHLALEWEPLDVWAVHELHERIGDDVEYQAAEAALETLASGLLPRLQTLHLGAPLAAAALVERAAALRRLTRLEVRLDDLRDLARLQQALPQAVVLNVPR